MVRGLSDVDALSRALDTAVGEVEQRSGTEAVAWRHGVRPRALIHARLGQGQWGHCIVFIGKRGDRVKLHFWERARLGEALLDASSP